jgi:hypothetical protein
MMASRARDARAFENGDGKMIDLDIPAYLRDPQEVAHPWYPAI